MISALPYKTDINTLAATTSVFVPECMARAVRCKTEAPRPTDVRAATMYQASNVEHLLRAIMGIRAHPRLTSGKTSLGHHGTQSLGCAGQTVRPSLHSISQ